MRRDAASIVANWPLWKQQIRLTKYSPEVDFGENKIMSVNQDEPVAELVKAMRHRHNDYVESICDLKARVAELEGALKQYADDYNWCYDTCNISRDIAKAALKERVKELEKSSISRTLLVTRLQEIPDAREMNLHDAEIIWSILEEVNEGNFDFKEPANEG